MLTDTAGVPKDFYDPVMADRAKIVVLLAVCLVAVLLLPLPVNLVPAAGVVWSFVMLRRTVRRE